jgi:hypothetical protein
MEVPGGAEKVEGAKQRMIESLTKLGEHADGPTKAQIQRTIDKLNEFDTTDVTATVDVNDQASAKIHNIATSLDNLFSKVGLPKPEFITRALGLEGGLFKAQGGQIGMPYKAGTGGGFFDQVTAVIGEGDAPEYVIPTDPKYRTRAIGLMTKASRAIGISGLAQGGVLDPVVDALHAEGSRRAVKLAEFVFQKIKESGGGKGRVAADFARAQVGKPYVWGASGPGAYDCSGLTSAAWRSAGVSIPRTSHAQIAAAKALTMAQATQMPGSLFFTLSSGSPSGGHIAISHGDGTLTNARGRATGVTITGPFGGRQGIPSFDRGGTLHPGLNVVHNGTGGPETLSRGPAVSVVVNNYGPVGASDIAEQVHRQLLDKQRRVGSLGLR